MFTRWRRADHYLQKHNWGVFIKQVNEFFSSASPKVIDFYSRLAGRNFLLFVETVKMNASVLLFRRHHYKLRTCAEYFYHLGSTPRGLLSLLLASYPQQFHKRQSMLLFTSNVDFSPSPLSRVLSKAAQKSLKIKKNKNKTKKTKKSKTNLSKIAVLFWPKNSFEISSVDNFTWSLF